MASLYFYDLETSGVNPRLSRIMQFAGQRVDMQLKPVSEPDNFYIKLSDDVLPEPDAILVTGLTPQKVNQEGISEAEFLQYFSAQIALPDTIFVGFNSVRFDDEFMRFLHYRNFYDAYEWFWKDGRSRWDMLDVVRMTRALRPEGIEWPYDTAGKPTNRLEYLTSVNKLEHDGAHDALSDVNATLAVARLVRNKHPKLFDFMLKMRTKSAVAELVESGQPFVYSSGKYPSAYQKTTVAVSLGDHPGKQGALVYDLRTDPDDIAHLPPPKLAAAWADWSEDETKRFPLKTLQYNRCPAVAPLGVLDKDSIKRLKLDMKAVERNRKNLAKHPDFYKNLLAALKLMDRQRQVGLVADEQEVDSQLYEGFFNDQDRTAMSVVRAAEVDEIGSLNIEFADQRLTQLLPLYKARNFPESLSAEEREAWETFRQRRLLGGGDKSLAAKFFVRLGELAGRPNLTADQEYLLTELQLYGESILPAPEF